MDGAACGGQIRYPFDTAPEPGAAIEVAPGILWMRLPLPMRLDHVNVYALDDGDGWTVIDTGFNSRRSREAWETLLAGPLGGRPVHRLVVTHHHPDHVGLAGWFIARGAELLTSRTAWLYARMLQLDVQDLPGPETLAFWRAAGMAADVYAKRSVERPYNSSDVVVPLPPGYTRLIEGQQIRIGQRDWIVRMGDGHAPEHVTLWQVDGDLVIGGDQILPSISANIGVYPTEPQADPLGEWLAACNRLRPHVRDSQLVLPGHKLPFTGLPLRLTQMEDNHHGALKRLRRHLVTPHSAGQCFVPIFGREITGDAYGLALVEAVAHINHLHKLGEIRPSPGPGGAVLWQMVDTPENVQEWAGDSLE